GVRGTPERRVLDRRQHLMPGLPCGPVLGPLKEGNGFGGSDQLHQLSTHVLMREPESVSGLVTDHAMKLGFGHLHREALEVQRGLVRRYVKDVRPDVRPVASVRRSIAAGASYLWIGL